ncbi:hypothetical protein TWF106_005452 [Orbilia oligospora]|uniref:Ribosomal protein L19 n=1 Tax=Orbilia oligospora TaxID=2813651 RepID=A0A6G1M3T8_ORBOL|nr:hypothetical protein TWF788_009673 [Orbilia oligospora]KAF3220163.1 hypothetical protein TWF191_007480 [Orbilia oligospora]KAF3222646.1 hypothetical protein TWF106_005452 [Orbilia oligospora]KAF3243420.1 hypothetical protein TWF192_008327 [Orbilia oligospora]
MSLRTSLSRFRDAIPVGPKPKIIQPRPPGVLATMPKSLDQLLAQLGTKKAVKEKPINRNPLKPPPKRIKVYKPPCPAPPNSVLSNFTTTQLKLLDPKGLRQRLFSRNNKDAILPGDILQIRFKDKNTEPFAGVLINIRRRGLDTAILLRNHLTRIGVEMWYKLYSPKIAGIDLVERKERRARRAKLYYMRMPKHDKGSVEGVVTRWKKNRMLFGGDLDGDSGKKKGKKVAKK